LGFLCQIKNHLEKFIGVRRPKGLNRIDKIIHGYICLREWTLVSMVTCLRKWTLVSMVTYVWYVTMETKVHFLRHM
jgi:hypothetical protein